MKNFDFIAAASESIKNVSKSIRNGNAEYTSLSRVLKDIQRSDLLKKGYAEAFEALGYEVTAKEQLTPAQFLAAMQPEQFGRVTSGKHEGEEWLGIWGWAQMKDEEGNKVYEEDGVTPVMEAVLRKVASWTPNRIFKCLAQANALASK